MNASIFSLFKSLSIYSTVKCPKSTKTVVGINSDSFNYQMQKGKTINRIKLDSIDRFYSQLRANKSITKKWFIQNIGGHDCDFSVIGSLLVANNLAKYKPGIYY